MKVTIHSLFLLLLGLLAGAPITTAAPVIVNEYNAVSDSNQIGGGDGFDTFFGTIDGNGGNWFELVVVGDGSSGSTVNMQGWTIEVGDTSIKLSDNSYWSDVRAGTILTFIETADAGGKDTSSQILATDEFLGEGWGWTNIFVGDPDFIDTDSSSSTLDVSNSGTQITIKDSSNGTVFGPAGEGIQPDKGVGSDEAFVLEADPSADIAPDELDYDDSNFSTFGSPNTWDTGNRTQNFEAFSTVTDEPTFVSTPPSDRILAGDTFTYDVRVADANGGDFAITAPVLPSWLTLTDISNGEAELAGTPTNSDGGPNTVELSATDNPNDGTATQTFSIEVFPSDSTVIVNEYNADNSWLELVVTGDGTAGSTVDLRGWTIRMEDDDGSSQIVLSDDSYWESVQAGTILLFSADNDADGGFDTDPAVDDFLENSGYATAHFWVGDEENDYLDNDETTGTLNVSNSDAKVSVLDGSGTFVFGPAGEGVFANGGVNGSERFALQDDPSPDISPFSSNFSDSDEASPGRPNEVEEGFQSFEAFATGEYNPAPFFTWEPAELLDFMVVATTEEDEYLAFLSSEDPEGDDTLTVSILEGPDWLRVENFENGEDDLIGDPESGDEGAYEITLEVSDGELASTLTFTLYVLHETIPVLVNEFNAVADDTLLDDGGKEDPFWGPVEGNGGDWFELVVVGDGNAGDTVDLRGWTIEITDDGGEPENIILSDHDYWSDVRAGTILTFTEDGLDAGGLDTGIHRVNRFDDDSSDGGWAWSNILVTDPDFVDQAASDFGGGFPISNDDTRIRLIDGEGDLRFGPVGEEFLDGGINSAEIFKMEQDPSPENNPLDGAFNDGTSSTFGAPNIWSAGTITQNFSGFHSTGEVNSVPYFSSPSPRFARQGEAFSSNVTADDFDGTAGLTITLDSGPAWLSVDDNEDGTATLEGTPTAGDLGLQEVTLSVSDGTDSASKSFSLYVHPATAAVILNEYNAVVSDKFLNGGDATTEDEVLGRIEGNGGDWFELVVVGNGTPGTVDLRGWRIGIADNAGFPFSADDTIVLSDDARWAGVPTGTILTFTEKRFSEGGRDTDWEAVDNLATEGWISSNVWIGDAELIDFTDEETNGYRFDPDTGEVSGVVISNDDTWFVVRDADGDPVFGPVGEGVAPDSGISSTEVFELEAHPRPIVSPLVPAADGPPAVNGYDDGSESTFGRPNEWEGGAIVQDFSPYVSDGGDDDPLEDYLAGFGLSGDDLLASADTDGDGANQLEEFAFGSDPTSGASLPVRTAAVETGTEDERLAITFLRRAGGSGSGATYTADGITYTVEGSLDLDAWDEPVEPTANPADLPAAPEGYEWATYRHTNPPADGRAFLQVRVEKE